MNITTPPAFEFWVTAQDLEEHGHLISPCGVLITHCIGAQAFASLVRFWGGVGIHVPVSLGNKTKAARFFWRMAPIIGEAAVTALWSEFQGQRLNVPTCSDLRIYKRQKWIRAKFDELTCQPGAYVSAHSAINEICILLAASAYPATNREVQSIVNMESGRNRRRLESSPATSS
jgi:hypothetical protein